MRMQAVQMGTVSFQKKNRIDDIINVTNRRTILEKIKMGKEAYVSFPIFPINSVLEHFL